MNIRHLLVFTLSLLPGLLYAETANERGWSFSERFQGSSNAAGVVLKNDSMVAYRFNPHVQAYGGVPVYVVRPTGLPFMSGVGNVYTGLFLSVDAEVLNYSSDIVATAPTGNRSRGFSTGRPTVDWTNTISRSFGGLTPYGSLGFANTISDTSFFVRPFSSKGAVTHFEAGALVPLVPRLSIGGSGYGVRAVGGQTVVSRVIEKPKVSVTRGAGLNSGQGRGSTRVFEDRYETESSASIANDHGFSTWVTVQPTSAADFQIGYSRSVTYQFNSVFFGVGMHFGR
jgi:hypothetical protein